MSTAPAASSALWGPLGGEERINIALFGYGGKEHKSGNYLADSIQIVSIDPVTDKTTFIPIPRDFWVEGMPQLPNNGKINEAFAVGWQEGRVEGAADLTTTVLSKVTGLEIHHWMAIDFAGFQAMVDAVGGVTFKNPVALPLHLERVEVPAQEMGSPLPEGRAHAERRGSARRMRVPATPACRSKPNDFARSVRQAARADRAARQAWARRLRLLGPGMAMMDALAGRMRTDLSAIDLFLLSSYLDPDRRIELKEGRILEATSNTIGQYILVVVGARGFDRLHAAAQLPAAPAGQAAPNARPEAQLRALVVRIPATGD